MVNEKEWLSIILPYNQEPKVQNKVENLFDPKVTFTGELLMRT